MPVAYPRPNKATRNRIPTIFVCPRARLADFKDWLRRSCGGGMDEQLIIECSPGGSGQPTHYAMDVEFVEEYPGYSQMLQAARWAKGRIPGGLVTEHPAADQAGKHMSFNAVMARDGVALKQHGKP